MQEREKIKYEKLTKCSATLHSLQFEIHFDKHSWCARNFWTFTVQHEILLSTRSHNKTMNAKPLAEETQDDLCQIDREMRRKNSKMQTKILPYLTELANERLVMDTGKYIRDTMILLTMCKGCCGYNTCLSRNRTFRQWFEVSCHQSVSHQMRKRKIKHTAKVLFL